MIEHLKFLEIALGSYAAAADYLGYSERQYYNLRKTILKGDSLKTRVTTLIINKVSRLKLKDFKETTDMNQESVPRLGRNAGRIEFFAALKRIQALLDSGYDRKKAHAKLVEDGCITMSYSTFCDQLKKHGAGSVAPERGTIGNRLENQRPKPLGGGRPSLANPPVGRIAKTEPFSIDKSKTLEDLV